ncbi:unnamed protein product [Polarella glacialis]|uniref:Uncharacterized protein n=1 Tax=Polarella glacialis TaxID=89957 RepID=A0A813J2V5_POLGL|nr:unnamed protein product [Polarella glacialis]CAE8663828.1 unnamed protein product [Polarella glacialis]
MGGPPARRGPLQRGIVFVLFAAPAAQFLAFCGPQRQQQQQQPRQQQPRQRQQQQQAAGSTQEVRTLRLAKGFGSGSSEEPLVKSEQEQWATKRGNQRSTDGVDFFNQAQDAVKAGEHEKALPLYRKARVAFGKAAGKGSLDYARVCSNLASTFLQLGNATRATDLYSESQEAFASAVGEAHPEYAACLRNLARLKRSAGDFVEAEALTKKAMNIYAGDLVANHKEYTETLKFLAAIYKETRRIEMVQPLLLEVKRVQGLAASMR